MVRVLGPLVEKAERFKKVAAENRQLFNEVQDLKGEEDGDHNEYLSNRIGGGRRDGDVSVCVENCILGDLGTIGVEGNGGLVCLALFTMVTLFQVRL